MPIGNNCQTAESGHTERLYSLYHCRPPRCVIYGPANFPFHVLSKLTLASKLNVLSHCSLPAFIAPRQDQMHSNSAKPPSTVTSAVPAKGLMSALGHVWTYMDPARLQQADWIGCNRRLDGRH